LVAVSVIVARHREIERRVRSLARVASLLTVLSVMVVADAPPAAKNHQSKAPR
jgi:hypothetical protein